MLDKIKALPRFTKNAALLAEGVKKIEKLPNLAKLGLN